MQQEPMQSMMCAHCGELFKTSQQHPRKYCSIACEEGRGPIPMSNPQSPDYHLYVQGEPEAILGRVLVANGLKRVNYSPDWCRGPDDWYSATIVDHDSENEIYVREDDVVLGHVVDYRDGNYVVEHEDIETGEITVREIDDSTLVSMIRQDRWWVDG
jgi:hypothetical protein